MTDKRFTITQDFEEHHRQIRDNGHIIMGCFIEPQAEVIVDFLNQLNDENEQLKQNIGIILKYCREKGKYAMDMKETKAHNVLQRILNDGDVE